jgi:hypothetical protein
MGDQENVPFTIHDRSAHGQRAAGAVAHSGVLPSLLAPVGPCRGPAYRKEMLTK